MKLAVSAQPSLWPARLDLTQSLTGLFLALFMWLHMFFVATILLGKDTFWSVARTFEGYFVFGHHAIPGLVSVIVAGVISIIAVHAILALRKFPANWKQYSSFWVHMRDMQHIDTTLWFTQVVTGFAMFFLASAHLYIMLSRPDLIDPYGSADRVWSGHFWPLYLVLLFCVELHGGIGLYRLALKWGWFTSGNPKEARARLHFIKWTTTAFFIILGLATLAAYVKIGIDHAHAHQVGTLYTPSWTITK